LAKEWLGKKSIPFGLLLTEALFLTFTPTIFKITIFLFFKMISELSDLEIFPKQIF